jgi:hypothetical protein
MTVLSPSNQRAGSGRLATHYHPVIARTLRYIGAFAVLATGVAHIEQYTVDNYSTVPTIGTLFLLNFVGAVVIAIGLIVPLRRVAGRYTDAVRALIAVGGIGLSVLSLVALFVSESSGLFGFVEHGYRMAIVVAIVAEVAATVLLVAFLLVNGTGLHRDHQTGLVRAAARP